MLMSKIFAIGFVVSAAILFGGYEAYRSFRLAPEPACSGSQPVFIATNGGALLFGKTVQSNTFPTKQILTLAGIPIPVCSITASITVKSETNYFVQLEKQWKTILRDSDKSLIVIAPPIKPLLPVNFDTGQLKMLAQGCIFINKPKVLNDMILTISSFLAKNASSDSSIKFAREAGRKEVEKFVKNWIIRQKQYERASNYKIHVFFADEPVTYY